MLLFPGDSTAETSNIIEIDAPSIHANSSSQPGDTQANISADPINSSYLLQLVAGLVIVLLCILVLAWFAKRMNRFQSSSDGSLQILGGLSMGARERVVLVQIGDEQLLLGVAPGRVNALHVLKQSLDTSTQSSGHVAVKGAKSFSHYFADKLQTALNRKPAKNHEDNAVNRRYLRMGM